MMTPNPIAGARLVCLSATCKFQQAGTLSAQSKPPRKTRWIDSKGKEQVDLAAIFDNEADRAPA